MGTKLSVSLEGAANPETAPRVDRPPTFDPQYGFERPRKVREMKTTWEEMEQWKLKPAQRDYCAHHLISLMKCQTQNAPFAGHACDGERGIRTRETTFAETSTQGGHCIDFEKSFL
ncbi:hypothetical protein L5515_001297 [Caenorhabditis briggsae]|uniref:NADH dehydrogenase [ubiquinone] 1 beta subcomplex subunit 7 n=1 Tax=Caenorhabditis briggsae TaxID=6238 RepID=A0AAE9E4V3_CAEBR|nr:hypothetical protein L5515_001297 [Caenorhabditis briggsae]